MTTDDPMLAGRGVMTVRYHLVDDDPEHDNTYITMVKSVDQSGVIFGNVRAVWGENTTYTVKKSEWRHANACMMSHPLYVQVLMMDFTQDLKELA